jgi:predicted dienelactone hydrolase
MLRLPFGMSQCNMKDKSAPKLFNTAIKALALGILSTLITSLPVKGAEKILLTFGPIRRSINVDSLAIFAKEGTINRDIAFYLGVLSPEQQTQFREVLLKRAEPNPAQLSRLFNSEIGEAMLTRIGNIVTIQGGRNGKFALRGAIVQAALDPVGGLTLLNVLQKLPVNMQIQGEQVLGLSQSIDWVVRATTAFTETMATLSKQEALAQTPPVDFSQLLDLRQPGPLGFQREVWNLTDKRDDVRTGKVRDRNFYVVVYKPQKWSEGKTYGFVVALPQHPGSDLIQAKALLSGLSREVFDLNEFIDRPKDISFVIDELERRNPSQFEGRLDLQNVGVAGHSFGGYGALAVAGAVIDFDFLQQECDRPFGGLNTSLLLQCRALSLPRKTYNFKDTRVKAVLGGNPVNSAIFGQTGISLVNVPLLFISGNFDPATPAVLEQLRSFVWITASNKYLGLIEGQAHVDFSQLDAGITQLLEALPEIALPEPDVLQGYRNGIIVAFFGTHIANNPKFRPYLSSGYTAYLSQNEPFKFFLISSASVEALRQTIIDFQAKKGNLAK